MSGPKRMSPLYVVFALLKMLRGLVPLIVIFGVQFLAGGKITSVVYWIGGAALVLLVLAGIL